MGGGWAMPRNSSAAAVVVAAAAPPENRDGESSQNGDLVFQKCWLGLGVHGNGIDLLECWFWVRIFPEEVWDLGFGRFLLQKLMLLPSLFWNSNGVILRIRTGA